MLAGFFHLLQQHSFCYIKISEELNMLLNPNLGFSNLPHLSNWGV